MGEVQVLDIPEALPQTCCVCGGGQLDGRKYIDTGVSLDYFGVVFFCSHCLKQIVRQVGEFVPIEEFNALQEWVKYYRGLSETLTQKVGALNGVIDSIEFLRSINSSLSGFSDNRPSGDEAAIIDSVDGVSINT